MNAQSKHLIFTEAHKTTHQTHKNALENWEHQDIMKNPNGKMNMCDVRRAYE